ncbi:MAG: glycosyltransferase [Balneolaceae bacterium]|nr:glycosyltransferase [Balneolaceae bacterium]
MAPENLSSDKITPLCLGVKNTKLLGKARKIYLDGKVKKDIDVYGRYGNQTHSQPYREKVVNILNGADFGFVGGFNKVITPEYLKELQRSKISVEVPGFGVLSYRLFESMALGAVVICKKIPITFPNPMIDGVHFVQIKPDLSDLVKKCNMLLEDESLRHFISVNAMKFYDVNFSPDSVARRIINTVIEFLKNE